MDPMDLFFVILTGGDPRRMRRHRQRQRERYENHEQQQGQNMPRMNKYMAFIQLLPLLVLVLFSVVPYLFQSVFNILFIIIRDLITSSTEVKNFIRKCQLTLIISIIL